MARPYPSSTLLPKGQLDFEEIASGLYRAFFTPPNEAVSALGSNSADYKRPVFDINYTKKLLTIFPYQVWGAHPMIARYHKLSSITFDFEWYVESYIPHIEDIEGLLSDILPSAFIEDYNYGLGFRKNYKFLASMLESFGIQYLHITENGPTNLKLEVKKAVIKRSDLNTLVKNIDNITERAQRVSAKLKKETSSDLFLQLLTNATAAVDRKAVSVELAKLMGNSTRLMPGGATKKEQREAMEVIRRNSKKIIAEHPSELLKLRNDIELVTLEELIDKFSDMLGRLLPESHWQKLLDENPFILNMAFGIPVIKVQGQASVGGLKVSGAGIKIADFLVKNSITNNAAIVEIKTPATKLINPKGYRGGVFSPSYELSGAINQILDQIFIFQKEINNLKASSREYALESYSVAGVLIAGTSLTDPDEQKSFELYRGNSKSVQIVTFDELLRKLRDLHSFLTPTNSSSVTSLQEEDVDVGEDLPF
jgi:hypothetical protein